MERKTYYEEINIAKGIGVLLVVLGHSFPDASLHIYNNSPLYEYILRVIYSFHMPLFFFLSGFLFANTKIENIWNFKFHYIKRKFFSLMIPYFLVSFVTLMVKYLLSNYAYSEFDFSVAFKAIFRGNSPNGGMWFLYTLFFIFCIFTMVYGITNNLVLIVLSLLFCVILSGNAFSDNMVYRILYYSFYFCTGIYLNEKNLKRLELTAMFKNWFYEIGALILLLLINLLDIPNMNVIKSLLGIYFVIFLSVRLYEKNIKPVKLLHNLGIYSMDIYILSYFVQIPIRIILYEELNIRYELCMGIMFIFGIVGSLILSKYIIRKNRMLAVLLLGGRK